MLFIGIATNNVNFIAKLDWERISPYYLQLILDISELC